MKRYRNKMHSFVLLCLTILATCIMSAPFSRNFEITLEGHSGVYDIFPFVIAGETVFYGYEGENRETGDIIQVGTENYCANSGTSCIAGNKWKAVDARRKKPLDYTFVFSDLGDCEQYVKDWNEYCTNPI